MSLKLMHLRPRLLATVALALAVSLGAGCEAAGGPVDKKAKRAAKAAKRGVAQRSAARQSNRFSRVASSTQGGAGGSAMTYETRAGYVVRGTDLFLFRPCGVATNYYLLASPAVTYRIGQLYKFTQPRPYTPMYVRLKVRLVDDTLTVGKNTFQHIADVSDNIALADGAVRECERPSRTMLVQQLKEYE